MAETTQEFGTIIGADAKFKGDLTFESAAKVMGQFEGSINAKGLIHIATGSKCKASIIAKEVAIEGHIEGNVEASDRVDLKPKGRITGDIVAARMSMADGASIVGHCRIGVGEGEGEGGGGKVNAATEMKPEPAMAGKK